MCTTKPSQVVFTTITLSTCDGESSLSPGARVTNTFLSTAQDKPDLLSYDDVRSYRVSGIYGYCQRQAPWVKHNTSHTASCR